ncbi:hypothetical protein BBJ28_00001418 [Nothophytophthora sp. Chile5]|nr:hypothetical protein BBJ28_00001418 [Nothophytophthora sp. Chile5]
MGRCRLCLRNAHWVCFDPQNFGDCFRKRLEAATSPSTHELLDIARIALVRSCDRFEDLYFMLLCIIHQQLQGDLNGSEASTPDPIQCVSKSLKLMEMLLSLTISMSTPTLRQVGSKMLAAIPACAAKSDRKVYYRKEIHTLSRCVSDMLSDSNEAEDWRMLSTEVEAFLQVYYVRIAALLPDMNSSCEQSGANTAISFFQLLMDQEDEAVFREAENAVARMSARDSGEECGGSPFDVLILMTASYAMMCRFLQVSGVVVDLEHWLSATTSIRGPRRKQVLRCFLKPWVPAFGDERSIASQSNVTSGWTLEAAVKYAGRSGALHLLVDFCLASGSHLTHKCLQEVCKAAKHRANLTQDVSIEAMPNVRGGVNDLHFQVCEAYLSELMAISRHLGPVRPFKHPIREAQASAGRLSRPFSIDHEFDVYLKQLSAELNGEEREKNGAGNQKSPLWMFVSQDERRLARGFRLLSCIVWHVEYVQEATAGGFERTFMADLIDEHLGAGESEGKMIRDFIIKAQEAISSGSLVKDQLRLFKGQQSVGNSHTNFPSRLEKITRSLVLAAWALWMREKTAYCVRSIHLGRQGAGPIRGQSASSRVVDIAELEVVGALAATCALQLGGLCVIYSSETDLFSVQLSLLEDAAKMNPDKTAAVICWGFPADKVQTRYLKRYKALRQVVKSQQTSENPALKEREQQCQFLQKHVKRSVYSRARPHSGEGSASVVAEPKRSCHVDVGVLMNCCCNGEFQQLIATLVKVTCKGAPAAVPADSSSQREDKSVTVKMDVQLEPSSPERLISRDEVMTLLQEQTRQLEEKIRTLTATADQRSHNEPLIVEPAVAPVHATVKEVTSQIAPKTLVQKHLCVRDLVSRRHSPADAGSDAQAKLLNDTAPLPVQRQDSVRNALKLFRLRQENSGHAQQKSDAPLKDGATKSSLPGENTIVKPDVKDGSDARKQPRTLRTEPRHLKPSTSTERRSKKHPNDREGAVFPLRFESGLDNLSLTLLGRSPHCRNPPVRGRQYVHHKPERLPLKSQHYPEAKNVSFDSSSAEFVHLKTTGAQTNLLDESSHSGDQPRPEEGSPLAQETSAQHQCQDEAKAPAQGVATQCRMGEETQSKPGRGTRAPPLLSIADKFPIYVDLDGAAFTGNRYKERKRFLQVARFAGPSPTKGSDQAANNEATEEAQPLFLAPSARPVLVSRNLESECGNEENQSDDQPSSLVDLALDREEWETEQQEVTAKYQASYRKHFPTEPPQNKLKTDREVAGGIESLLGLRDNMQRMTQRLRALETCANSIDDEFKASHQRLDRIEDNRLGGISLKERVLENVDAVLATTETRDEIPTTGILSKKASSDLAAAKYDRLRLIGWGFCSF